MRPKIISIAPQLCPRNHFCMIGENHDTTKNHLQHKIARVKHKEMSMKAIYYFLVPCTIILDPIESVTRNNDEMRLFLFFEQTRK